MSTQNGWIEHLRVCAAHVAHARRIADNVVDAAATDEQRQVSIILRECLKTAGDLCSRGERVQHAPAPKLQHSES